MKQVLAKLEDTFRAMAAYTTVQRERTAEDIAHIVEFLSVAVYTDDDELFTTFMTWTADILSARRVPARSLPPVLDILMTELKDFPRALRSLHRARTLLAEASQHTRSPRMSAPVPVPDRRIGERGALCLRLAGVSTTTPVTSSPRGPTLHRAGPRAGELHLDCEKLRLCDSTGLSALLMIHRRTTPGGSRSSSTTRPPLHGADAERHGHPAPLRTGEREARRNRADEMRETTD